MSSRGRRRSVRRRGHRSRGAFWNTQRSLACSDRLDRAGLTEPVSGATLSIRSSLACSSCAGALEASTPVVPPSVMVLRQDSARQRGERDEQGCARGCVSVCTRRRSPTSPRRGLRHPGSLVTAISAPRAAPPSQVEPIATPEPPGIEPVRRRPWVEESHAGVGDREQLGAVDGLLGRFVAQSPRQPFPDQMCAYGGTAGPRTRRRPGAPRLPCRP